jgi:hypothetical protein
MAGALIRCACGKELEVPTMQHVRQLKVAPQEASKGPPASSWGNRQRVALIGATFLLLGLALSGWNLWYYHPPTLLPVQDYPPEAAWNLWCALRQGPDFPPTKFERLYEQSWLAYHRWMGVSLAVAAIGLLVLGSSLCLPKHSVRRRGNHS